MSGPLEPGDPGADEHASDEGGRQGDLPLGDDDLWRDGLRRVFAADQAPFATFGPLVASLEHDAIEFRGQRARFADWDASVVVAVERTYEVQGGLHAGSQLSIVTWSPDPDVLDRSDLLAGSPVKDHLFAGLSALGELDDAEEAQRLGRLLRPKKSGLPASFYTLVSRDTVDQDFAQNRQRFLAEQGYSYTILDSPALAA